jgi:hypothetical protein
VPKCEVTCILPFNKKRLGRISPKPCANHGLIN